MMRTRLHDLLESAAHRPAWPLLALLIALMYIPTYMGLGRTVWQSEESSYGPLILLAALFVTWLRRGYLRDATSASACVAGVLLLATGLLCYVLGRSQAIAPLDVGSQLPVIAGALLILGGWPSLRAMLFPVLYLFFCIPLPGVLIIAMTEALKVVASKAAEQFLWFMGYPVARTGVMLVVGPYRLLVADACSGLHSMISLAALGVLYLNLAVTRGRMRQLLMVAAVIPIALAANVVRIVALALITFYFGDEAGQGFLHELAGLLVFAVALALFLALHRLVAGEWRSRYKGRSA
jgi:exosortase B